MESFLAGQFLVPYFMSETEVYGEYEELTEEEFEIELLKTK